MRTRVEKHSILIERLDDSTSGYYNTLTSPKVTDNISLILNAH